MELLFCFWGVFSLVLFLASQRVSCSPLLGLMSPGCPVFWAGCVGGCRRGKAGALIAVAFRCPHLSHLVSPGTLAGDFTFLSLSLFTVGL